LTGLHVERDIGGPARVVGQTAEDALRAAENLYALRLTPLDLCANQADYVRRTDGTKRSLVSSDLHEK
jgi:hypothetical protein